MRALEDLFNEVHDPRSKEYVAEAIRAYHADAFRACIVSLWVAVALDVTGKIRMLSEGGDPSAQSYMTTFDLAVKSNNLTALTKYERELLEVAHKDFEFISSREYVELKRLQDDRHLCAHPAFVEVDKAFSPTPEACRAHMSVAVDSLLKFGPTPGKVTFDRFFQDISGQAWPRNLVQRDQYLRVTYFSKGRESVKLNLCKVIIKGCISIPDQGEELIWKRMAQAAHSISRIDSILFEKALHEVLGHRSNTVGFNDDTLLRFAGTLSDLDSAWTTLPSHLHSLVDGVVAGCNFEHFKLFLNSPYALKSTQLSTQIEDHISHFADKELIDLIGDFPHERYINIAIEKLRLSNTWQGSGFFMEEMLIPLASKMDSASLDAIFEVFKSNDQVQYASRIPRGMSTLLRETKDRAECLTSWQGFSEWLKADNMENPKSAPYDYLGLIAEIDAA